MSEPNPQHHTASQAGVTVTHNSLHCNELEATGSDEPSRRNREAWRHPLAIAAVLTAMGTLINALTPWVTK